MEFGKVGDARGIDFRLPPDHASVARILAQVSDSAETARVFSGCPVWQDDGLARKVCPPGTPKAKRLAAYARQFATTELNSTGYGLNPDQAREWAAAVPAGFRFCPKVPRDITLARDLNAVRDGFARHLSDLSAFGDRLGAVLLQFLDGFGPSRFPELESLLAVPHMGVRLALEVRHPAWFRNPAWTDRLAALLENKSIAMVITDTPGRRDVLHMRLTAPWTYVRMNGCDGGETDDRRLDAWSERAGAWIGNGLREAYFIPHLDPVDGSADFVVRFLRGLQARTGLDLGIPRLYSDEEEPRLAL